MNETGRVVVLVVVCCSAKVYHGSIMWDDNIIVVPIP